MEALRAEAVFTRIVKVQTTAPVRYPCCKGGQMTSHNQGNAEKSTKRKAKRNSKRNTKKRAKKFHRGPSSRRYPTTTSAKMIMTRATAAKHHTHN